MADEPDERVPILLAAVAELKKTTVDQCYRCDGLGTIRTGNLNITCPVCKAARRICDAWEELTT